MISLLHTSTSSPRWLDLKIVPSAGPSIVVGSMEMLCKVDSSVKSWGPTRNGPLLSCPCLLDLETCEALDEVLDEALDEDCDACEDALDDALEVDLLSRARHLEFAHI